MANFSLVTIKTKLADLDHDLIQGIQADRKLLESVFDRIPGMIYVHDLVNDINLYRSWTLKKILGYSNSPQLNSGKGIRGLVHPDDIDQLKRAAKELFAAQDNQCVRFEYRMRHRNGDWLWFRSEEYVFERNEAGIPIKCLGYATDLTSNVTQQLELDELNRVNQFLLKAAQILTQPDKEYKEALQEFAAEVSLFLNAVCDISMLDVESGIIHPEAMHYPDREVMEVIQGLFSSMTLKAGVGLVGSVIETGEEVLIQTVPESMKRGPSSVDPRIVPVSLMYVPLRGSLSVLGSLNITRLEGQQPFSAGQTDQIRRLGDYVSLFVENSLLRQQQKAEAERRMQAEGLLEEEKRWVEFKLEMSSLLADVNNDLESILQRFAEKVALHFDVVCDIHLVNLEEQTISLVALHHYDKATESAMRAHLISKALKVGEDMIGAVVASGKEFLMTELPDSLRAKREKEGVNPLIIPRAFVYLPLTSHNHVLGTLDLTRLSHQTALTEAELIRVRNLANHAARFMENRLLQSQQNKEIALRREAEQKLERTGDMLKRMEAETRAMLNAIPIYIARISKDLRYLFMNDTYKNMGVIPRTMEGNFINQVIGEEAFAKLQPHFDKALSGQLVRYDYDGLMPDGVYRYFNVALAPDFAENGEVIGFYSCATDISSKVTAEKEAKLTQDRLETLSLNSGDAFFFHEINQKIVDVNQVAIDMLGYTREELLKMKAYQIDPRWNGKSYIKFLAQLKPNTPQTFDTVVYRKDGSEIPVEVRFVKREEGKKVYIQSLIRDRTEKREQEIKLQRSEERLRLVFDNVEDHIAIINKEGVFESINKTAQGLELDDVVGTSIFDFYDDQDKKEQLKRNFERLKESGGTFMLEDGYTGPDGTRRLYSRKFIGIFHGLQFYKAILIVRDVTAERDREQSVMNAVLRGQEQERKRLGAELHDGIGQVLSAIALQASQIKADVDGNKTSNTVNELNLLSQKLQEAIREVRNISHDLMPEVLESFGLKVAMTQLCSNLHDRSGLKVKFDPVDLDDDYDPLVEVNLYRIAQELLNNVQKHSKGKNVFVSLIDHGDSLNLTVEDDGSGFDLNNEASGIGLKNIRSRLKVIDGQIDIESAVNSGTLINIDIPKK